MKCPKCGYLGFETVDRCRNCGYDFSLSAHSESPAELPLNQRDGAGAPFADFDLGPPALSRDADGNIDLDRLIGTDSPASEPAPAVVEHGPVAVADDGIAQARSRPSGARSAPDGSKGLPLFSPSSGKAIDAPLITSPRPVRPPLSVRRSTPDIARVRPRPSRPRPDDSELNFQIDSAFEQAAEDTPDGPAAVPARDEASRIARLAAMLFDLLLLGGIDAAIIYLTLAIAGLTLTQANVAELPIVPTAAFLLLLNGGYLVAFTTAGGQTIGKMLTGIRVMTEEGTRVDLGRAVLRAGGCLLSLFTAGLAYLPALFSTDARALHDRLAGTRVVRAS